MLDLPVYAATVLLMYVVLPIWILAGLADYCCHRAMRISETSGAPESLMHLAQFGLIAIPTVLAMIVRINAAFFLVAAAAILLHHAVAYIDIRYANRTRQVPPVEQMVHSFLEIIPIAAFLLLAVLHWQDLIALLGGAPPPDTFLFRLKDDPLPLWYIAGAIAAASVFNGVPYLEELIRCMRHLRRRA